MKFLNTLVFLPFVFAFVACDTESSVAPVQVTGTKQYERHLSKGENVSMDCYVYSTESSVTVSMRVDLPMYSDSWMTMVMLTELGDDSKYTAEIVATGVLTTEIDESCATVTEGLERQGGKVTCSDTKIHGEVKLPSYSSATAVSGLIRTTLKEGEEKCDHFYDTYKENFKDIPGAWGGDAPAQVGEMALYCDVTQEGDVLKIGVGYEKKQVNTQVTVSGDMLQWTEQYIGMDDVFDQICASYRSDPENVNVTCLNGVVSYSAMNEDGYTLEDVAVGMKKGVCPALLDGSMTLEDLWSN